MISERPKETSQFVAVAIAAGKNPARPTNFFEK